MCSECILCCRHRRDQRVQTSPNGYRGIHSSTARGARREFSLKRWFGSIKTSTRLLLSAAALCTRDLTSRQAVGCQQVVTTGGKNHLLGMSAASHRQSAVSCFCLILPVSSEQSVFGWVGGQFTLRAIIKPLTGIQATG